MYTIDIPKKLTEIEFEEFLEGCSNVEFVNDPTIELNFCQTEFITSFCMILFILLCESLIISKRKNVFCKLSNSNKLTPCMHILARLGFFDNLPDSVTYYPYRPRTKKDIHGKNKAILEITEVKDADDADKKIDSVEKAIRKNTNYSCEQIKDICIMVAEILQNIFYHSKSKRPGLIAIQNYPKIHNMQMVIADAGIGIPESLKYVYGNTDNEMNDVHYILESVKKGVSRLEKSEDRGEGLARCVQLAKKHNARVYIRSNCGWVSIAMPSGKGKAGIGKKISGTQIFVNFPTN